MRKSVIRFASLTLLASMSLVGTSDRARAQTYPIDCAILLCLSGGWPASVPCVRARAVFIRRITPWPVEPPLQIWNCPMHASLRDTEGKNSAVRLYDIVERRGTLEAQSTLSDSSLLDRRLTGGRGAETEPAVLRWPESTPNPDRTMLRLAQAIASGKADIDIGGPEFDFVRSIQVWQVEYRHRYSDRHGCTEYDNARLGTYGVQGDYRWSRSSAHAAPAWMAVDLTCRPAAALYRAVGVAWRDHLGNPGREVVRY